MHLTMAFIQLQSVLMQITSTAEDLNVSELRIIIVIDLNFLRSNLYFYKNVL